jgi:16S rRNA (cytosine967-C5)-methyltransferase
VRIDRDGAYANLVLPPLLERSGLEQRDRGFVTELVYGTTRMRRSCDWLVDRFLPDPERIDVIARNWLRLGAFQLVFLGTPPHAAVSATVDAAPRKISGLCNAVLRKVATSMPVVWPSDPVRVSEPDWIFRMLSSDLGGELAVAAFEAMNESASMTVRDDGYVQDDGSQRVADAVGAGSGERILDMCAAPGGKATALANAGAFVVAADVRPSRVGLVASNRARLGIESDQLVIVTADGLSSPFRPSSFDRVLLDAPCSGLGALRRRPDARWRIAESDIDALTVLQRSLLDAAISLTRPGGDVIYSVCTLTDAETRGVDESVARDHPELVALDPPGEPWVAHGRGAILLPQVADTDGMYLLRLRVPEAAADSRP